MIVFGAIAPHGNPVYEQPDGPTANGMHELARRLRARGAEAAADVRRVRLTGRVHSSEVRVARGGVAMLAAMFTREFVEDAKQARREGAWPTVDDPTRAPKAA